MGAHPHDSARKDQLIGAIQFAESLPERHCKSDIFKQFGFSNSAGWKVLREKNTNRTIKGKETRGRKKALSDEALATLERFIETEGFDARAMKWEAMPAAAGLDLDHSPSGTTIRRAIQSRDFRVCMACQKKWTSQELSSTREEYCRSMLEKYPQKEDWHQMRFTGETHFSFDPQGRVPVHVHRRPWERICPDCLIENRQPEDELDAKHLHTTKRLHAWAAVGYNGFKDGLHWYEVPPNLPGKLNLQTYHEKILQPIVGAWVAHGDHFVLEEDDASGHSGRIGNNIVKQWKEQHGIVNVFNCAQSPDLIANPIEKAWRGPKNYVRRHRQPHWDEATLKSVAQDGFNAISPATVNSWIDAIPQILSDCVSMEGSITGR